MTLRMGRRAYLPMSDSDNFSSWDLRRFVDAQNPVWPRVLAELRAGQKTSHWMWFVFPQIEGLGRSPMAQRYAIASLDEAAAYLAHPILGPRLEEATRLVLDVKNRAIDEILGPPDDLKFRSSMTLFSLVPGASAVFNEALQQFFDGEPDELTLQRSSSR
jgi:uncharacterized protein (DUF1810 family)